MTQQERTPTATERDPFASYHYATKRRPDAATAVAVGAYLFVLCVIFGALFWVVLT